MARQRSPDREKAENLYIKSNGEIKLKDIADTLGLPEGTVRGWKNKDKWEQKLNGTFQKETKKETERSNKKNKVIKGPIAEEVKEVLENTELTDKQRLFCIYYIKYFNATKAYQKAYNSSYAVANVEGYRLLVKPSIKSEIDNLKKIKLNRAMLSEDDIFQKYIDIAFSDITDYVEFGQEEIPVMTMFGPAKDEEGNELTKLVNVVKFKQSTDIDGTILSEVKQGKDGASIKLHDKMKALQWLSDRMDLLPTETRIKIDNEKVKVQMAREKLDFEKAKTGGDSNANDGVLKEMLEGLKDGI